MSATICAIQSSTPQQHIQEGTTIAEMRAALQAKSINLDDTAFRGKKLDDLIRLLYPNLDIVATSLKDLPGTDIMLHEIDTGNAIAIRQRCYRYSPTEKQEISRQINERLEAQIIEPSFSQWSSPIVLATKRTDPKNLLRFLKT